MSLAPNHNGGPLHWGNNSRDEAENGRVCPTVEHDKIGKTTRAVHLLFPDLTDAEYLIGPLGGLGL